MAMPLPIPHPSHGWTLEMVHALPDDGNRYELIDGELLVSPSPSLLHQRALLDLYDQIRDYVRLLGGHETLVAPAAVPFSIRRELQPDLFVLPLLDGRRVKRFEEIGRLLLAVEVLSPSTARNDRYKKPKVYQQEGVPEYWIVDPPARQIERWRPADEVPDVVEGVFEWHPAEAHPPLTIDIDAMITRCE